MENQISIFKQSGSNNPENYVYNTTKGTFSFTRISAGIYDGVIGGGLTIALLLPFTTSVINNNGEMLFIRCEKTSSTEVQVTCTDQNYENKDLNSEFTLNLNYI